VKFGLIQLAVITAALTACGPSHQLAEPPPGFPSVGAFEAVDRSDYSKLGRVAFLSPKQTVDCTLDWGPQRSVICSGFQGVPTSVPGTGCSEVRRGEGVDAPYVIARIGGPCVTAKSVLPMNAGRKLVAENSTCVVGKEELIACIDADHEHGFVLAPSGSWAF
jgi:hypothetical protein